MEKHWKDEKILTNRQNYIKYNIKYRSTIYE